MKFLRDKSDIMQRARQISLLLLDVDGVLTNGQLYFDQTGEALKAFNTLDGHGIKLLQANGIRVGIISGRKSPALTRRASALGITLVKQGREDKLAAMQELLATAPYPAHEIAFMGDDLPDLPVMLFSGLAITVPNAHQSILDHADICTGRCGGEGAVREAADFLLQTQNKYDAIIAASVGAGRQS